MKTLCVAIVVLSLSSVGQSASLACEKLLKPVDTSPDLSGRWHVIAMSSDVCLVPALFNAFFWPSVAMDISAHAKPTINSNIKVKMYGYCGAEPETHFLKNNKFYDVDSNNDPTGDNPDELLYSGCPDCLVIKGDDVVGSFLLLSRRTAVTAAELTEFETQAACLGWSKPQVLNTDHEYVNCIAFDDDTDVDPAVLAMIYNRLRSTYTEPLQCMTQSVFDFPQSLFEWIKEQWNSL